MKTDYLYLTENESLQQKLDIAVIKLWNQLKKKVPNTSYKNKLEEKYYSYYVSWVEYKNKDITCIGYI